MGLFIGQIANTQPRDGTQPRSPDTKVGAGPLSRTPPTRRRRGRPVPLQKFELQGTKVVPLPRSQPAKRLARPVWFSLLISLRHELQTVGELRHMRAQPEPVGNHRDHRWLIELCTRKELLLAKFHCINRVI